MAVLLPIRIWRGQSRTWRFTIWEIDTDERKDLDVYDDLQFQVKTDVDEADPPLISKSLLGGGLTKLDQSADDTIGQLEVTLGPSDTAALEPAVLKYDLWGIIGTQRYLLARPADFTVDGVVNGA